MCRVARTRSPPLPWRGACDAERQLDAVRNLFFHLPRHDTEVTALDAEVGADDQEVAFLVRDALAELVFQVGEFHRHGDLLRNAFERERASDIRRCSVHVGLCVLEFLSLEGDFGIFGGVHPLVAEQVLLLHGVADMQRRAGHDDLALGGRRVRRVKGNGARDAGGVAVDRFQRRVELENSVVDAFGVFEVKRLRGGQGGAA